MRPLLKLCVDACGARMLKVPGTMAQQENAIHAKFWMSATT